MQAGSDTMTSKTAELWFAGKRMDPERKLSSYVGSNEKTKVVIILQEEGDPRPRRERVRNLGQSSACL